MLVFKNALIALTCLASLACAQEWVSVALSAGAPAPAARRDHAMAYDRLRNETILFGGRTGTQGGGSTCQFALSPETWIWADDAWAQGPAAPAGLSVFQSDMEWDPVSQRIILFSGATSTGKEDGTWAWNGIQWTELTPTTSPPPRTGHKLALDEARQRIVLFGGVDEFGLLLSDVWEWTGSNWNSIAVSGSSPSARHNHGLAWCDAAQKVVLFGGRDLQPTPTQTVFSDTWTYESNGVTATWTEVTSPGPGPRFYHTLSSERSSACVPGSGRVFLWGGSIAPDQISTASPDLWAFDGASWSILSSLSPAARRIHELEMSDNGRFIMFGGIRGIGECAALAEPDCCLLEGSWELTPPTGPVGTLPGPGDDLVLMSFLGQVPPSSVQILTRDTVKDFTPCVAPSASPCRLDLAVCSPLGGQHLWGKPLFVLADIRSSQVTSPIAFIPWLHVNVFGSYIDVLSATLPGGGLQVYLPGTSSWSFTLPGSPLPGGTSIFVQAFVLGETGIAVSDAHEFRAPLPAPGS